MARQRTVDDPDIRLTEGYSAIGHISSSSLGARSRPAYSSRTFYGDLLMRSGVGDAEAFAELYDATSSRMYSLVLRQFPAEQADGILTRIYLDLWRSAPTYGPESGHALCWLISRAQHGLPQPPRLGPTAVATSRAGRRGEQARHGLTRCPSAYPALTRAQHEALVLVYLGRYTLREAGQLLEVPKGAVAVALRDGLLRLGTGLPAAS